MIKNIRILPITLLLIEVAFSMHAMENNWRAHPEWKKLLGHLIEHDQKEWKEWLIGKSTREEISVITKLTSQEDLLDSFSDEKAKEFKLVSGENASINNTKDVLEDEIGSPPQWLAKGWRIVRFAIGHGNCLYDGAARLLLLAFLNPILETLEHARMLKCYSLATLEQSELASESVQLIQRIAQKAQLPLITKIVTKLKAETFAAFGNILVLSPHSLEKEPPKEQEFIVAHECMHLYHKDGLIKGVANLVIPMLSSGILKTCQATNDKFITYLQAKYSKKDERLYQGLSFLKNCNEICTDSFISHYVLNAILSSKLSCFCEMRADYSAVLALKGVEGAIQNLKKYDNYSSKGLAKLLYDTHPSSQERIEALEQLKAKMNW